MDIRQKIEQLRKEKGWTVYRLAQKAGVTPSTIYSWYNKNDHMPSRDSIEGICAAFGISEAVFFTDIETDNLTEKELQLLELFRQVPEKKKDAVLTVVQSFVE